MPDDQSQYIDEQSEASEWNERQEAAELSALMDGYAIREDLTNHQMDEALGIP